MRWLGGISVDRSKSNDLVVASARVIAQAQGALQLIVPPEGTRAKTRYWKRAASTISPQQSKCRS